MCSIVCSFNKDNFYDLIKLNQYRGTFSYSVGVFDKDNGLINIKKKFGEMSFKDIPSKKPEQLYIGHVQSPTGGLIYEYDRIHPSKINNTYLYHNGILKQSYLNELKLSWGYKPAESVWDTKILHQTLLSEENTFLALSSIDGSFACLFINGNKLYLFRSEIVNLYYNNDFDISSILFKDCNLLKENIVFELNISDKELIEKCYFRSLSSPYYFVEE